MAIATVSDRSFGPEVLGATLPVLVEFIGGHAPTTAALDELSRARKGRLKVVRVDVDHNPTLKDDYAVRGLPTLIVFKHGKPVARRLGVLRSKAELEEWADGALILALATRRTAAARSAKEFTLANGLRVVVIPDHRVPVVTQLMWYLVGSADELKDFSGLASLVMNLSFKRINGNLADAVQWAGGEMNARIDRAATMYWNRVPSGELELAMQLEARRMSPLEITDGELATERNVVLEQARLGTDNEPRARLIEKMQAALSRAPTFRSLPMELASEITHLARAEVVRFHDRHYAPNNAILVVAGDVMPDEVQRLAENTYQAIPANPDIGESSRTKPSLLPAAARVVMEDTGSKTAVFHRSYAVPAYGAAGPGEAEALDVLAAILAGGIASRLYCRLVIEEKLATAVTGRYLCNAVDAGQLTLAVVSSSGELRGIETAVDAAIEDIRANGVSQSELRFAKKTLVADYIYGGGDQLELAHRYASAKALGYDINQVEDRPAAISRVSAEDVRKVAKSYVVAHRSVTGCLAPRQLKPSHVAGRIRSAHRL